MVNINKQISFLLIFIVLVQVMSIPAQNRTRTHDNSKNNRTQHTTHVVPKQNKIQVPAPRTTPRTTPRITPRRNKSRVIQQIDNSKKTDLSDDLISGFIGLVLDIIGKISEFQEMVADWPIIG